jgi:hypothetical protein
LHKVNISSVEGGDFTPYAEITSFLGEGNSGVDSWLAGTWDLHDPNGHPRPVHRAVAGWAVRTPDTPAIPGADGTLRCHGQRIERVLLRHPAVRQAAVVRPTADTALLVAYVEPEPGWSPKLEPAPAACASSAEADAGTTATIRALCTDSLLEIGSGVAGVDRACSSHHRVTSIAELRDSPKGRFGAVLIDGFSTAHGSLEDLLHVVARAIELTVYGGAVVIGGVRSLPLLAAAYEAAELAEAEAELPEAELGWRVQGRLLTDTELAVHPAAFTALADEIDRVATVSIAPRYERTDVPRYDVVVHVGDAPPAHAVSWLDWTGDGLSLAAIRRLLLAGREAIVGVRGIPARHGATTPAPADLVARSTVGRYRCRLSAAAGRADGSLDAVWCHESVPDHHQIRWPVSDSVPESLANDPLRPLRDAALRRDLRTSLSERFAAYEVPDLFVVLDRLPLTPGGRVDRNALPLPHWVSGTLAECVRPFPAYRKDVSCPH